MPEDVRCPICGSETVIRTAKKGPDTGKEFYVCTRRPDCKWKVLTTQQISELEWSGEKSKAYKIKGHLDLGDPKLIKVDILSDDVHYIWHTHNKEINEVWYKTNQQHRDNLVVDFHKELKHEWRTEFSQIQSAEVFQTIEAWFMESIKSVYLAGYIMGKGWISVEQLIDFELRLGDNLATQVKSAMRQTKSKPGLKWTKSSGMAYTAAFNIVGVLGTLANLETDIQKNESSKSESIQVLLLMECIELVRRLGIIPIETSGIVKTIKCPFCQRRRVETTVTEDSVRGFIIITQRRTRTLIGCIPCLRRELLKEVARSLLLGWFSLAALFNLFYILFNSINALTLRRTI